MLNIFVQLFRHHRCKMSSAVIIRRQRQHTGTLVKSELVKRWITAKCRISTQEQAYSSEQMRVCPRTWIELANKGVLSRPICHLFPDGRYSSSGVCIPPITTVCHIISGVCCNQSHHTSDVMDTRTSNCSHRLLLSLQRGWDEEVCPRPRAEAARKG